MNAKAMEPLGHALLAYVEGDLDAELAIRRDDGLDDPMPVSHFFRGPSEFTDIERCAISLYQDANRKAGRYIGEIRLQIGFRGKFGPSCGWLHVDPDTMAERAELAGWKMSVVCRDAGGQYLARLTKLTAAC